MKCIIRLNRVQWQCIDETGKNYCAFDEKKYAIQYALSHGFTIVEKF